MRERVRRYIEENGLLRKDGKVVVALSGGADSVALAYLLQRLGYDCMALHCNFHLRGEESDRDEMFVREFCQQQGIELYVKHFRTAEYAKTKKISIEMAARELRYEWFEQMLTEYGAQAIAVAHHKNDQAETIVLNMKRGTGLRGLQGMRPRNGHVVRPLLCVTRQDIENYLVINHLGHIEDSTNNNTSIKRNAIRKQLGAYTTQEIEHIAETAERMQDYVKIVDNAIDEQRKKIVDGNRIDIDKLLNTVAPKTILYELLKDYGFKNTDEIYEALTEQAGKRFYGKTQNGSEYIAIKDRDYLFITQDVGEEITYTVDEKRYARTGKIDYPSANADKAVFDAERLQGELSIRQWKHGDMFRPLGLNGKKKVSDFLTDLHIPLHEKEQVSVMCCGDEIAWVIGYRIDERYKITDKTKEIKEIRVVSKKA